MREYFTIVVKENSNENLGLLTEKLNAGFHVDRYYEVGKGGIFILEKFTSRENTNMLVESGRIYETAGLSSLTDSPTSRG